MKKVSSFILSLGIVSFSFAQSNRKMEDQLVIKGKGFDNHHTDLYTFSAKDKQAAIAKINRDYDLKVTAIVKEQISKAKRNMLIKKAAAERDRQLKAINEKFNSKYNSAFANNAKFDKH